MFTLTRTTASKSAIPADQRRRLNVTAGTTTRKGPKGALLLHRTPNAIYTVSAIQNSAIEI